MSCRAAARVAAPCLRALPGGQHANSHRLSCRGPRCCAQRCAAPSRIRRARCITPGGAQTGAHPRGVLLPRMRAPKIAVDLIIDTSGSMGDADLAAALSETRGCCVDRCQGAGAVLRCRGHRPASGAVDQRRDADRWRRHRPAGRYRRGACRPSCGQRDRGVHRFSGHFNPVRFQVHPPPFRTVCPRGRKAVRAFAWEA